MRLFLGVLLIPFALAGPAVASAQESADPTERAEEEARARFRAGRALVSTGEFASAHREFQTGYELSRRPLFLFNMAECSVELGENDRARREYAEYLRQDPEGPSSARSRERLESLGAGDDSTPEFIEEMNAPRRVAPSPRETARAAPVVVLTSTPVEEEPERRWYAKWPFWTAVGVVVVSAVVVGVVVGTRGGGCEAPNCFRQDLRMAQGMRK